MSRTIFTDPEEIYCWIYQELCDNPQKYSTVLNLMWDFFVENSTDGALTLSLFEKKFVTKVNGILSLVPHTAGIETVAELFEAAKHTFPGYKIIINNVSEECSKLNIN